MNLTDDDGGMKTILELVISSTWKSIRTLAVKRSELRESAVGRTLPLESAKRTPFSSFSIAFCSSADSSEVFEKVLSVEIVYIQ